MGKTSNILRALCRTSGSGLESELGSGGLGLLWILATQELPGRSSQQAFGYRLCSGELKQSQLLAFLPGAPSGVSYKRMLLARAAHVLAVPHW